MKRSIDRILTTHVGSIVRPQALLDSSAVARDEPSRDYETELKVCVVDVVKHTLGLLQWAMQAKRDGWELLAERGKEHRIVVLPFAPGGNVIGIDRPVDTPGGKGQ